MAGLSTLARRLVWFPRSWSPWRRTAAAALANDGTPRSQATRYRQASSPRIIGSPGHRRQRRHPYEDLPWVAVGSVPADLDSPDGKPLQARVRMLVDLSHAQRQRAGAKAVVLLRDAQHLARPHGWGAHCGHRPPCRAASGHGNHGTPQVHRHRHGAHQRRIGRWSIGRLPRPGGTGSGTEPGCRPARTFNRAPCPEASPSPRVTRKVQSVRRRPPAPADGRRSEGRRIGLPLRECPRGARPRRLLPPATSSTAPPART
jgi:hypothetical protein